jgi:hypothetical protein
MTLVGDTLLCAVGAMHAAHELHAYYLWCIRVKDGSSTFQ